MDADVKQDVISVFCHSVTVIPGQGGTLILV